MRRFTLFGLALLFLLACNKDKLATKPSIKIKNVSSGFIPPGGSLTIEMEFADKEGDISNSLFVQKIRTNLRTTATIRDTFSLSIPVITKSSRGDIEVVMDYNNYLVSAINPPTNGNPPVNEDDTLIIRFALRDVAGNVSDTVSAGTVIVGRN